MKFIFLIYLFSCKYFYYYVNISIIIYSSKKYEWLFIQINII